MFEMKGLGEVLPQRLANSLLWIWMRWQLNKDGSFTVNDLRNTKMVVQLDSEAIKDRAQQVKCWSMNCGHKSGLSHDDKIHLHDDPLWDGTPPVKLLLKRPLKSA